MPASELTIEGRPVGAYGLRSPLVSVVLLNQNYARFVGAAIDSIRQQDYSNFECLVIDNASTDDSRSVIMRHVDGDPRFRLIWQDKNAGVMGTWQKAIDIVRGEFVTFLDSDDIKFSNFISSHVQVHLALRLGVGFTSSRVVEIDTEDRVIVGSNLGFGFNSFDGEPHGLQPRDRVPRISTIGDAEYDALSQRTTLINPELFGWYWSPSSANVYRRSVLNLVRPDNDPIHDFIDGDIHFSMLCHILSGSAVIDQTLSAYRIHSGSTSNTLPSMSYMRTAKRDRAEAQRRQRQLILRILLDKADEFRWIIKDRYWQALDQQSGESGEHLSAYYANPEIQIIFAEYLVKLIKMFGFETVQTELTQRLPPWDLDNAMLGALLAGASAFTPADAEQCWKMIDWCARDSDDIGRHYTRPAATSSLVENYSNLVTAFGEERVLTELRKRYRTRNWWRVIRRGRRSAFPPLAAVKMMWREIWRSVVRPRRRSIDRAQPDTIRADDQIVVASSSVDYRAIGTRDAIRTGWFRPESRELFKGFPILKSDLVIDVGCGDGGMAGYCLNLGARVVAIDMDLPKLSKVVRRFASKADAMFSVVMASADSLPIESETADKIVCTEVLEHVDDPAKVLSEFFRIGKKGARYLFSVPDAASEHVLKRLSPAEAFEKPNHVRIIERSDFEKMVTAAGLQVENHSFYSFYWAVWNAIVWKCNIDFDNGHHPALDNWARTWQSVLDLPEGDQIQDALNLVMPKNQVIIARKP